MNRLDMANRDLRALFIASTVSASFSVVSCLSMRFHCATCVCVLREGGERGEGGYGPTN